MDGIPNGGTTDAARHIYWMDRTSQKIRPRKALKPAEAHEMANERNFRKHKSPIQDSVAIVMDLYDKKVGVKIGAENKSTHTKVIYNLTIESVL